MLSVLPQEAKCNMDMLLEQRMFDLILNAELNRVAAIIDVLKIDPILTSPVRLQELPILRNDRTDKALAVDEKFVTEMENPSLTAFLKEQLDPSTTRSSMDKFPPVFVYARRLKLLPSVTESYTERLPERASLLRMLKQEPRDACV